MHENVLRTPENSLPFGRREGPPRDKTIGGAVTADEKSEVDTALEQSGFISESDGIRELAFAFARSAVVRDAVFEYRKSKAA
jgi:hypothetical protein